MICGEILFQRQSARESAFLRYYANKVNLEDDFFREVGGSGTVIGVEQQVQSALFDRLECSIMQRGEIKGDRACGCKDGAAEERTKYMASMIGRGNAEGGFFLRWIKFRTAEQAIQPRQ